MENRTTTTTTVSPTSNASACMECGIATSRRRSSLHLVDRARRSLSEAPRRMRAVYRSAEFEQGHGNVSETRTGFSRSRRVSSLDSLPANWGTTPSESLYLFRAPGIQARIGLGTEKYVSGEFIEGTVVVYRDGELFGGGVDYNPAQARVEVALLCETARRKVNLSYRSGQHYRPQDIGQGKLLRYNYTRTLVPASQKWGSGPWEAQYHHATVPFMPPTRCLVSNAESSGAGARAASFKFRGRIPRDAPPSVTWTESKRHAHIDLRYRIVALIHIDQHTTLMAETNIIVIPPPQSIRTRTQDISSNRNSIIVSRTQSTLSRYILTVTVQKRSFTPLQPPLVRVSFRTGTGVGVNSQWTLADRSNVRVALIERVSYNGRIRFERALSAVPVHDDGDGRDGVHGNGGTGTLWQLKADGMYSDMKLGPLCVTHEVRVWATGAVTRRGSGELQTSARVVLTAADTSREARSSARELRALRKQPPIHYYFQDDLPHHPNLEYRAARSGDFTAASIPVPGVAALAARLPCLTHTTPTPETSQDGRLGSLSGIAGNCDVDVCCLCLDELGTQRVTRLAPCGHVLHHSCAQKWLRHLHLTAPHRVAACPLCKTELQ